MRQLTLTKTILALKISAREEYQFEFKVIKNNNNEIIMYNINNNNKNNNNKKKNN